MRQIHVAPGLRLRFVGRDAAFNEGVEIGLLAANLATGVAEFTVTLAAGTMDQARALATSMGYRLHIVATDEDVIDVMFLTGSRRPKLQLIRCDDAARSSA